MTSSSARSDTLREGPWANEIDFRSQSAKRRRDTISQFFFEQAAEGGYVVTCPALPGLVTEGDTLAKARHMAHDGIRAYIESLRKDGEPVPRELKRVPKWVRSHNPA